MTTRLILASGSPRRRELLSSLGVPFEVSVSAIDEKILITQPEILARHLAEQKALAVAQNYPTAVILAADTVVAVESDKAMRLLAKPMDDAENRQFLQQLSGRKQQVFTGVAVWKAGNLLSEVAQTDVYFRQLLEPEIAYYAATGEGLDKAGGYGIQGLGALLVTRIEGEYSTVVGLPLSITVELLRKQGLKIWGV